MSTDFYIPPISIRAITPPNILTNRLQDLIGEPFVLTKKTRTDGSNVRKLLCQALESYPLPAPCPHGEYNIIPPKSKNGLYKGVPKVLREAIDTYIVTTGKSYNLQVWNRNPASEFVQVEYTNGENIRANDVRLVLVRISPGIQQVTSVLILTPEYIEREFGKFGKQTVKQQLLIPPLARARILSGQPPIFFRPDEPGISTITASSYSLSEYSMHDMPQPSSLLSLEAIKRLAVDRLIGLRIEPTSTKTRGQALETIVVGLLGYGLKDKQSLAGGYPDVRHQALEVKVQDSPCVDLGMYSPEFDEGIPSCPGFTTTTIRYIIALTDSTTSIIEGAIICPGSGLENFTFVGAKSFKCQRSIPMSFFDKYDGTAVFNPES